jgi:hypothetical protein
LDDVAPAERAPAEPSVVTEFRTLDGLVVTLTGSAEEDQNWITVSASFDSQQAAEFATAQVDEVIAAETDAVAPGAEAEAINARVTGWRYRIPEHQFEQLARRQADLLRAPD